MKNLKWITLILVSLIVWLGGCAETEKEKLDKIDWQTKQYNIEQFNKVIEWAQYGTKFPEIPDGASCTILESDNVLTKYKIYIAWNKYANVCVKKGMIVSVWKNY